MDERTTTAVENRTLPPDLADAFRTAFGLDRRPGTIGEWTEEATRRFRDAGVTFGPEDLCTADETRHVVRVDGEVHHLACVLDALLFPLLRDGGPAAVRSRSPVSGDDVELHVSSDAVSVTPEEAVMSFGIVRDADPVEDLECELSGRNVSFCPSVNAFPDEAEYEVWAAETPEAATTVLPLAEGFALAKLLASHPPFAGGAAD